MVLTFCNGLKDQLLDGDFTCKKSSESLWINHTSEDSEASSGFWLSLLHFVSQCWWVCHLLSKIHSCYVSFWMHKCLQLIISFVLSFHPFICLTVSKISGVIFVPITLRSMQHVVWWHCHHMVTFFQRGGTRELQTPHSTSACNLFWSKSDKGKQTVIVSLEVQAPFFGPVGLRTIL